MYRKSILYLSAAVLAVFVASGCGTAQKKVQSEIAGIKTRVETLEMRVEGVESKQVEAERAAAEQTQVLDELKSAKAARVKTNVTVKHRGPVPCASVMDIQRALKNAGYYAGKIDSVKGKATRKAIKDFQRANGLKPDGIVGPRTWEILSNHLTSVSPNAASVSESIVDEAPADIGVDEGAK